MASLTHKVINGSSYYYARICRRVNGKPKIIQTLYLGTVDRMIQNAQETVSIPEAQEVRILELGATAALIQIARRLRLVESIDRHVPKRKQGPSVGEYLLIAAINRAAHPTSKVALADWFDSTVGPRMLGITPKQLSSQAFWNHMNRVGTKELTAIENDLLLQLIREFKVDLNCLLYDATNFYTYINTRTKSELAQRGHNKQKRHDLRQVSLGMMTTADFHIPLLHLVYGGNVGDAVEFGSVIDELVRRYKHLTEACPHITLVFDKGNNSEANIEAIPPTGLHFVGSLKLNQCRDLLNVPLRKYRTVTEEGLEDLKTYRVRRTVFGQERTVLITHNENLLAGQLQGLGHNLGKCKSELRELQTRLNRWATGQTTQGKKPTLEGVDKNIETILRREYMSKVIKTTVADRAGSLQLNYQVDQNAIGRLTQTVLGKTILFTDNHEWTDDQIVRAYRAQYHLEHAFREMKNPHVLGWNPRGHWTDQKIRVHAFYCVMALTLVSLLRREFAAKGLTLSAEKLMENLNAIRETISVYPQEKKRPPKLSFSISQMNSIQQKLYDLLNLSRFRTN